MARSAGQSYWETVLRTELHGQQSSCGVRGCWVQVAAGMVDRAKVTRVSLSDWLALRARIRGSKDPRLLRDRPADGAAWARKFMRV